MRPSCFTPHADFLAILPAIERHARLALRHLPPEAREDACSAVLAAVLVAYVRLVERGRGALAYPPVLVRYALRHLRAGRRVGTPVRSHDVLSASAQRRGGFRVLSLDRLAESGAEVIVKCGGGEGLPSTSHAADAGDGSWKESLVADRRAALVAAVAAFRIDFDAWLKQLAPPKRRSAELLAIGHSTGAVASRLNLTPGRISQLRRELHASWQAFQEETPAPRQKPPRRRREEPRVADPLPRAHARAARGAAPCRA
ncbi:MAG: hypothetical protein ACOY3P_12115 [Planctomycetota bacterium]